MLSRHGGIARVPRIELRQSSGSAPALKSNALRSADGMNDRQVLRCSFLRVWALGLASLYGHTTHIVRPLHSFLARN